MDGEIIFDGLLFTPDSNKSSRRKNGEDGVGIVYTYFDKIIISFELFKQRQKLKGKYNLTQRRGDAKF